MKVQLSDFCSGHSDENIASAVQHVLLLNLFPELVPFCKDLTEAMGLVNTSPSLEPCRASTWACVQSMRHRCHKMLFPLQVCWALLMAIYTETAELVPTEAYQSRATHRLLCFYGKQFSFKKTDRSCTTISPAETEYPQFYFHI